MTAAARAPETELRLGLAPGSVPRLLRHDAVIAARSGPLRRQRIATTYFDTPDAALGRAGIALRLRRVRGGWRQSVKGAPTAGTALVATRDECEWPVAGPNVDVALADATPWHAALAAAGGSLAPRFVTDVLRRTLPLALPGGTSALLCVDTGIILDAGSMREREISEIELELVHGDVVELVAFAGRLCTELPLAGLLPDKAERGYALLAGRPDHPVTPVRATTVQLAAATPAVDAFRLILAECVRQIIANAAGVLAGDDDPEWIHQLRIGLRRTRSLLGILARHTPAGGFDPLTAELRWLAATLGVARDRDVFDLETLGPLRQAPLLPAASRDALARLHDELARERAEARRAARAAVGSTRATRLLLALSALVAAPAERWIAAGVGGTGAARPVAEFAARLLTRRAQRVTARGRALDAAAPEARHALRIAAKKLRYAAEFFAPAFGSHRRTRGYIAALARLQQMLGDLNDAAIALRATADLARRVPATDVAVATVAGWLLAQAAAREPELVAAWERFRATRAFWRARR